MTRLADRQYPEGILPHLGLKVTQRPA